MHQNLNHMDRLKIEELLRWKNNPKMIFQEGVAYFAPKTFKKTVG